MAYLFTSESVSEGHPDKVSDQISDALLDAFLAEDPRSRVAVETLCTTGLVVVAGEVTCDGYVDVQKVVRETIEEIGYTDPALQFDAASCGVLSAIHEQSPDIAQGVDEGAGVDQEQGAGDQGLMFGYACRETSSLMPLAVAASHEILRRLAVIRKAGEIMTYLRPDAKSQVTLEYADDRRTINRVDAVVVSTQHSEDVTRDQIEADLRAHVIPQAFEALGAADKLDLADVTLYVNPTGRFVIGGPHGDAGLTGRKIIVDTYGGKGGHGGGAFSGKDPSKVDRSAAYAARYVAKNIVAAELADEVLVQVAYAIGVAKPVSITVDTYGTGQVDDRAIVDAVQQVFDLSPKGIIERLGLLDPARRPAYRSTAAYGHFGREDFPWEALDAVDALKEAVSQAA
ncbi:MAG: methionine adenosyltransferase [Bacteroidota bacterium]